MAAALSGYGLALRKNDSDPLREQRDVAKARTLDMTQWRLVGYPEPGYWSLTGFATWSAPIA
jgi:hypothetical protein